MSNIAATIEQATGRKVLADEAMNRYNSLRVGGAADYFVEVYNARQLVAAVQAARSISVPYAVIGNGTNLIVTDKGVRGLVIRTRAAHHGFATIDDRGDGTADWQIEAGALWGPVCREAAKLGWGDISWGISIPGSMGGAVVSNAGAHGGDTKGVLTSATVLTATGEVEEWPAAKFALDYRSSILKAHERRPMSPGLLVLTVNFRLEREEPAVLSERMRHYQAERIASQPAGKTAGSTFKNPPGDKAGRLIEAAGLKGYTESAVQFSSKHANFLMNLGEASYAEARHIIEHVRGEVARQFGVELELEIEVLGEE